MSDQDAKGRPKYESPTAVLLGEMAKGAGYCSAGGSAFPGYCSAGTGAEEYCRAGTIAGAACTRGDAAAGACTGGSNLGGT